MDGAAVKSIRLTFLNGETLSIPVETIYHNDWREVPRREEGETEEDAERRLRLEAKAGRFLVEREEVVVGVERGKRAKAEGLDNATRTMMEPTGLAVCLQGVLWRETALGDVPDEVMKQFIGHYARLGATQIHFYTRHGFYADMVSR